MIYLDYAATTPCCAEAVDAMLPYFSTQFGNAASIDHAMGARARAAVDEARANVALLVGAEPEEVIFTSGSTEANNLALQTERAIVTSRVEHPSVLDVVQHRREFDAATIIEVDENGLVDDGKIELALQERSNALLSIMTVNNEIGVRQNVEALSGLARQYGALFHTDATQALVTAQIAMKQQGVDALSISAHKMYGPKGVGALVCNAAMRRELAPILYGGGHERGLRSGTLNVPGIVGFGVAAKLAQTMRGARSQRISQMRDEFVRIVSSQFNGELVPFGGREVSPHIVSLRLVGINNRALLKATAPNLCFSLGSACATMKSEPSHVLVALGRTVREANETVRISFGEGLTLEEVREAARQISVSANRLLELVA